MKDDNVRLIAREATRLFDMATTTAITPHHAAATLALAFGLAIEAANETGRRLVAVRALLGPLSETWAREDAAHASDTLTGEHRAALTETLGALAVCNTSHPADASAILIAAATALLMNHMPPEAIVAAVREATGDALGGLTGRG
ncbi:hypothetical protein ACVOMT_16635 [Sphingomonas panni]